MCVCGSCCCAVRHFCTFLFPRATPPTLAYNPLLRCAEVTPARLQLSKLPADTFFFLFLNNRLRPDQSGWWAGPLRSRRWLQIRRRHLVVGASTEARAIRSQMPRLRDSVNAASCNDRSSITAYCISAEWQNTLPVGLGASFFFLTVLFYTRKFSPHHCLRQP